MHRYAGLAMAVFLLIAGVTGSLLTFYHELDVALNPGLYRVAAPTPNAEPLDVFTLRERAEALMPGALALNVPLHRYAGEPVLLPLQAAPGGNSVELENDELFLNPYTGEVLGQRHWGDITQGSKNLMPFIYKLHYSLALGSVGSYIFGIVALIWTLDCFIGFYLTLPMRRSNCRASVPLAGKPLTCPTGNRRETNAQRSFWQRWKPAWLIRHKRLNFDLHRAGGLWLWALLLVFAWSSVGLNLGTEIYNPVMSTAFELKSPYDDLPVLAQPQAQPGIPWREAHHIARTLMAEQAATEDFTVLREDKLYYIGSKALFLYRVKSDRDIYNRYAQTTLAFDANSGAHRYLELASGQAAGNTVTHWLYALHFGDVFGLPYRIFVCLFGLLVAGLSVTGLIIWWRKRRVRVSRPERCAVLAASEGLTALTRH